MQLTRQEEKLYREMDSFLPLKELKALFTRADVDRSGTIDREEFLRLLGLEPDVYTTRMFELFDTDADDQVSLSDFIVGLARFRSRSVRNRRTFVFCLFDADGSGTIDSGELSFAVIQRAKQTLNKIRRTKWGDKSKDPVLVSTRRLMESLRKEYPRNLDFEAFNSLISGHLSLFKPAFEIWACVSPYAAPAAKVVDKLVAAGHKAGTPAVGTLTAVTRCEKRQRSRFVAPLHSSSRALCHAASNVSARTVCSSVTSVRMRTLDRTTRSLSVTFPSPPPHEKGRRRRGTISGCRDTAAPAKS